MTDPRFKSVLLPLVWSLAPHLLCEALHLNPAQHSHGPSREVLLSDGVVEIPGGEVRIIPGHVVGLLRLEVLDALVGLQVELEAISSQVSQQQISNLRNTDIISAKNPTCPLVRTG